MNTLESLYFFTPMTMRLFMCMPSEEIVKAKRNLLFEMEKSLRLGLNL